MIFAYQQALTFLSGRMAAVKPACLKRFICSAMAVHLKAR
ncbi:Uncharacterised protein [Vibrio cholerae]|nr:Uncharacterised protein [Vibrio cholerae]